MTDKTVLIALAVALYLMGGLFLLARKGTHPVANIARLMLVVGIIGVIAASIVIIVEMLG